MTKKLHARSSRWILQHLLFNTVCCLFILVHSTDSASQSNIEQLYTNYHEHLLFANVQLAARRVQQGHVCEQPAVNDIKAQTQMFVMIIARVLTSLTRRICRMHENEKAANGVEQ